MNEMGHPRVFLTGATGTVGGGVLEALASAGCYDVTCLVRQPHDVAHIERSGARAAVGDMEDMAFFQRLRGTQAFEFIIHAAQAPHQRHPQEEIDRLERIAVRNLERLCSPATRVMIFTGGVWSYGTGANGGLINELTPFRPFKAAERRVELVRELTAQWEFPWVLLDPPSMVYGTVGPAMALARALQRGEEVEVLDDEGVLWSVIERVDLGRAYLAVLQHGRTGDCFVVAEDQPVSVPQFHETIAQVVPSGRVVRKPLSAFAGADPGDLERRCTSQPVDSSLLKTRTGWRARESFLTSVDKLLRIGLSA